MGKFTCQECSKIFSRKYTLQRHIDMMHSSSGQSDTENSLQEVPESEESSTSDTESEEVSSNESMKSEDSSEDELTERQPVTVSFVRAAYNGLREEHGELFDQYINDGKSEKDARRLSYQQLLPKYRKTFRKSVERFLIQHRQFRMEPIYKAVIKSARDLQENEDFDFLESIRAAIQKRKFLLNEQFPSDCSDIESE